MAEATSWPIVDTPNTHGMFMLGTNTLYLCHMPMFTKEDHYYQLTLRATLDAASMTTYLRDSAQYPGEAYNLINLDSNQFTLPEVATGQVSTFAAAIYRGYSNANGGTPGPMIVGNAVVTVQRVVVFRAFNQAIPRPDNLTYVLFGAGNDVFLDHYIAMDPDFQHLLTLQAAPTWLSAAQLSAGVLVSFAQASTPIGCSPPLDSGLYSVKFQGIPDAQVPVQIAKTVWYSTGNMLNSVDPCTPAETVHKRNRG
jgi:hypothetical protein